MGAILGLGMTHVPLLAGRDENMSRILRRILQDPALPAHLRTPDGWPEPMRKEWSSDEGLAAAKRHRAALLAETRKMRRTLDEFAPDFVVVWGDDQYENFKEDIIPPFCVFAYDAIDAKPWEHAQWPNAWDEPKDTVFSYKGHRQAAKHLVGGLIDEGFDVAYAYQPLHHPLGHAFTNTLMFLAYDRQGLPYPVIPFQVNCYGRRVIAQRGYRSSLAHPLSDDQLDPPSPTPKRCLEVGAATVRALRESPWRAAVIASSSWSHAFLVDKHYQLYPDTAADRRLYEALRVGDYDTWRATPLSAIEESGQHELLNWYMLAGAMAELGRRATTCTFIESWIFNSNKCFAVFKP